MYTGCYLVHGQPGIISVQQSKSTVVLASYQDSEYSESRIGLVVAQSSTIAFPISNRSKRTRVNSLPPQHFKLRNNASMYCITIHYDALQARGNLHVQDTGIDYNALIRQITDFPGPVNRCNVP